MMMMMMMADQTKGRKAMTYARTHAKKNTHPDERVIFVSMVFPNSVSESLFSCGMLFVQPYSIRRFTLPPAANPSAFSLVFVT